MLHAPSHTLQYTCKYWTVLVNNPVHKLLCLKAYELSSLVWKSADGQDGSQCILTVFMSSPIYLHFPLSSDFLCSSRLSLNVIRPSGPVFWSLFTNILALHLILPSAQIPSPRPYKKGQWPNKATTILTLAKGIKFKRSYYLKE